MFRFPSNIIQRCLYTQPIRLASSGKGKGKKSAQDSKQTQLKESNATREQLSQESNPQPITSSSIDNTNQHEESRPDDLYKYLWLRTRAHHTDVLESYETFVKMAASHLDIEYVRTETPFRLIKRRTFLASRFVKKKYRVQYEVRTYYKDILFKNLTGSTLETFLEYVERNLPEGILLGAEKHRLGTLPFDLVDNSVNEAPKEQQLN